MNNETQIYDAGKETNFRTAIEKGLIMSLATGKTTIIKLNGAQFCVHPDTKLQKAIDVYLEVKNKMFETEQLLKQKVK